MSYGSQGPNRDPKGLSEALWASVILEKCIHGDRYYGVGMYDDFIGFGGILATADGAYASMGNRYLSQQTSGCTIVPVAATPTPATVAPTSLGAIALVPTNTDGDTVALAWGTSLVSPYHAAPFAVIPGISGDMIFEARFKISSVAASLANFFIGLAGQAATLPVAADVPITSSDAFVTTMSILGFGKLGASTTALGLFYERSEGTVGTKAAVGTLAADTYIKAGFKWDGNLQTLTPWIDGVEIGASRVLAAATAATPWPNDYMVPVVAVEEIGTTALTLTLDWWACAQKL